ncbi:hypothetical protein TraAM80_02400 [Trypanosoma rangeli]|uniref:Exonuclease domain-containing protein n=1 Tax=Trypanosoma rangeli TaxID=5698 RepID=A0A3R7KT36_TRYRA|nr:uncharacterized protein TraAM80_02400 [Trypanosoma rangeli]RNF09141.1 hypothetical protein TraAM80_02400 [Trypanosoma rangeli]|eukprot:RNF09141.1 hypothetical protein TraAM80_02400 [Trypanosoma rangeli]
MSADNMQFHTHSPRVEPLEALTNSSAKQTGLLEGDHSDGVSNTQQSPSGHAGAEGRWWTPSKKAERRVSASVMPRTGLCHGIKDVASFKLEKCRVARSLAIQWLSLLMHSPPDASALEAYRRLKLQQGQHQGSKGAGLVKNGGVAHRGALFVEVARRGVGSSSFSSTAAATVGVNAVSDAGTQHEGKIGSSKLQPCAETFELVPVDEQSVSELIRLLREIALVGASLGSLLPHKEGAGMNGVSSSPPIVGGSETGAADDRVTGYRASASDNGSVTGSSSSCNCDSLCTVTDNHWEDIKSCLNALQQLVQNREELTLVLDTLLGSDWCPDDDSSPNELEGSCPAEVLLPPSQATSSAGIALQRASFLADGATAHGPKHQEEVEEAQQQQRLVSDNVKTNTLNHKAVPFESRLHSVLASPPLSAAPYYFSRGSTSTQAVDPHTASPASCASYTTTPLLQCSGSPVEPAGSGMTPVTTAVVGSMTPSTAPSSFSPGTTFKLESREDMLRRRTAAAAAAAHYAHNNSGNYYGNRSRGPWSGSGSPLLPFMNPVVNPSHCPYDYLLVLDFEATCEESIPPSYLHEIIEFPVVLVDVKLQRAVAEFRQFVRPKVKPQLSEFCRRLTGIRQEDIDNALPLEEVIRRFERWHANTIPPGSRTMLATDGPADLKEFMYVHSVSRQGIRFPSMFYQWIDVKRFFAHFFQCQQGKIRAMLDALNCPFEGRLHSGIDDARNVANIVIRMLKLGCSFCEIPLSRLPYGMTVTTASLVAPETATATTATATTIGPISSAKDTVNASSA